LTKQVCIIIIIGSVSICTFANLLLRNESGGPDGPSGCYVEVMTEITELLRSTKLVWVSRKLQNSLGGAGKKVMGGQ
jgi:hypothetical protein